VLAPVASLLAGAPAFAGAVNFAGDELFALGA
jgi:hypothetical protein